MKEDNFKTSAYKDKGKFVLYSSSEKLKIWTKISELKDGFIINKRYKIIKQIGRGGFGVVYEAEDLLLSTKVALKFINPDYLSDQKKFLRIKREINISRKITDKRIVKIFSIESIKGVFFLVMELLKGQTLKEIIKAKGILSWNEYKLIFNEIVKAISVLHKNNIIHRDIKPSNIFITENNEVKILDFGLSKEVDDTEKTSTAGEIIGTPQYISPELVKGEKIDKRSDIYQLGLTSLNILTGKLPFSSNTASTFEILIKRINEKPDLRELSSLNIPKFLKHIVNKSLEPKKDLRFSNINEIMDILSKEKVSLFSRLNHFLKKRKKATIIISVIIIFIILITYKFAKSNNNISYVKYDSSKVLAYNPFGMKLWEKDFSPFRVFYSYKAKNTIGYYDVSQTKKIDFNYSNNLIIAYLNHEDYCRFPYNKSIRDNSLSSQIVLLDNNKNEIRRNIVSYSLNTFEFINNFYFYEKNQIKINDNTYNLIFSKHTQGMFPSFVYILRKDKILYIIRNPGYIEYSDIKTFDNKDYLFLVGKNNPLCHMNILIKMDISNDKGVGNIDIIPYNSNKPINRILVFYYFLPQSLILKNINGKNDFDLYESINSEELNLKIENKRVILNFKNKNIKYIDKISNLKQSYALINKIYRALNYKNSINSAVKNLNKLLKIKINSPYLNSIILYQRGLVELRQGKYDIAIKSFKKSLTYFNKNSDSVQKLCEIEYLRGNYDRSLKLAEGIYKDLVNFWGLSSFGKKLFRFYINLQTGNFEEAKIIIQKPIDVIQTFNKRITPLISIYELIRGYYNKSLKEILKLLKKNQTPFTVIEYRMLLSRVVILNEIFNKDFNNKKLYELVKFYLKDIYFKSIFKNNLAGISYAYTLVKDNKKKDALFILKKTFKVIDEKRVFNFETRYWNFYDYFIYAKSMELLKNYKEAVKGYELSIKSNPYTHIALYSKKRIKFLKNHYKIF